MIGHSERRHIFMETDEQERKKVRCALDHGFKALLCIGETEEEKETGKSMEVMYRQLAVGFADITEEDLDKIWVAYEPVWAIGVNGKPITNEYADEMITGIRDVLESLFGEKGYNIPIFYGGSVNPGNAVPLSKCKEINGLFIGRSAWDADKFNTLIRTVLTNRN